MTVAGTIVCVLIGALVAAGELLGRYRAFPATAITSMPGVGYILINAVAAGAAFIIATAFDWRFGFPDSTSASTVTLARVLIAGFGAMALLRSSLFVFTQGDTKIDAGPTALLAGLRTAVDRAVDQRHAQMLLGGDLLAGLSFARDNEALTLLCSTALVNPDEQSAEDLGTLVAELKAQDDVSDDIKLQIYAMKLVEVVGRRPLESAANRLRNRRLDGAAAEVAEEKTMTSASASTAGTGRGDKEAKDFRTEKWLEAHATNDLLKVEDSSIRVDLQLLRACALGDVDRLLGAIAFSEVELRYAEMLLGAETALSSSAPHVGHRLLRLLQPQPPRVGTKFYEPRPITPPSEWVYAAALYELWSYIDDSDLVLAVLGASIKYRDFWDVRTARAAVLLHEGRIQEAVKDLDRALDGEDRNRSGEAAELVVIGEQRFDPVLRPLRELLEHDLPESSQLALWNAAVDAWELQADVGPRRLTKVPDQFRAARTPGERRLFPTLQPPDLPRLLRTVATTIPPRVPFPNLRASDFAARPDDKPPDPSLITQLQARFGSPPLEKDDTLPWRPDLSIVLAKPLEDWLQARPDLSGTEVMSHEKWIPYERGRALSELSKIDV
jgi:hypothetical protein